MICNPYQLGATLYMPATRQDIVDIALHHKIPALKSMVICLEDAVSDQDLDFAMTNFQQISKKLSKNNPLALNISAANTLENSSTRPLIFLRPRNWEMAREIIAHYDLSGFDGLVIPKFTLDMFSQWENITKDTHLIWMPTLETQEVFNAQIMQDLATTLHNSVMKDRVIALRVGGNDLMNVLGIRRSRTATIYEGPLGYTIKMLSCIFGALGFSLTSPVFELLNEPLLLEKELEQDLLHGFVGKTAIHPNQIEQIQQAWMVDFSEYTDAKLIFKAKQGVYQHAGAMCEPATHHQWAKNILTRGDIFGFKPQTNSIAI